MTVQFGKYELLDQIGFGSQSTVTKAFDKLLERFVALKTIQFSNADQNAQLLREARPLAKLRHPNIVTLYEVHEEADSCSLVIEYVNGKTLRTHLEDGPLSPARSINIIEPLASALSLIHSRGIIHRDIKPSNIMIDEAGAPRLIDFGLARQSMQQDILMTIEAGSAEPEDLVGTIPYLAPEVINGEPADHRSDIFSLGAVFYELVIGERPFAGNVANLVLNSVLNDEPSRADIVNPAIPSWIARLIARMLIKDPARRLQSADELLKIMRRQGKRTWRARVTDTARTLRHVITRPRSFPQWLKLSSATAATVLVLSAGYIVTRTAAPPVGLRMEQGIERVQHFTEKGAVKDAQKLFGSILADDPEHAGANAGMALALIREYTSQESDPAILERASVHANAALNQDPQLALANIAIAWTLAFADDYENSHSYFISADILDPENKLTLEGRSRLQIFQENEKVAKETLEHAIALYPSEIVFYRIYGELLYRAGKYGEAEIAFRRSISLSRETPVSYAQLAQTLHAQNRTSEAIKTVQDGLKISKTGNLYNNLGTYLFFQGQYAMAAEAFERTLELDGNSHRYLYWANLGDAYKWVPGKGSKVKSAYKRAIQLISAQYQGNLEHTGFNSRIALYYAKIGDIVATKKPLSIVLNQETIPPIQKYRAAVTFEINGDRSRALELLIGAIESGYPRNEINNDPELAMLRQDPAYHNFLADKEK